jgi:hypothetical protein
MIGRHPRLAIDAFLGIEPDKSPVTDHSYVSGLQNRLKCAYSVALRKAKKKGKKHKRDYDLRVREPELKPGDRVLVRNVDVRGKSKFADGLEKDVNTSEILSYDVKKENSKERSRVLHRNL